MRNICVGIAAIAVSVGTMSVAAQGRNFSGTWVVDSEKTMAAAEAAGMGSGGGTMVARSGGGAGGAVGAVAAAGGGESRRMIASGGEAVGTRSAGGGGAVGGVMVSADTVITMDGTSFSIEQGGTKTSYPLNGTEVAVTVRNYSGKARATWQGDTLVITQTVDMPNGPVTSSTNWSMEGDSLLRESGRKTYYKRK
jgi:hypothetical protein